MGSTILSFIKLQEAAKSAMISGLEGLEGQNVMELQPKWNIFVSNLPYDTKLEEIKELFSDNVGDASNAVLFNDEQNKPRGCGILEYHTEQLALMAIGKMNRWEYKGRKLVVKKDFDTKRDKYGRSYEDRNKRRNKQDESASREERNNRRNKQDEPRAREERSNRRNKQDESRAASREERNKRQNKQGEAASREERNNRRSKQDEPRAGPSGFREERNNQWNKQGESGTSSRGRGGHNNYNYRGGRGCGGFNRGRGGYNYNPRGFCGGHDCPNQGFDSRFAHDGMGARYHPYPKKCCCHH